MPPRAAGSSASIPSRTASDTWSQILSGCPSDTDSLVNSRLRIFFGLPPGTAYVSLVVVAIATTAKYDLQQGSPSWRGAARAPAAMGEPAAESVSGSRPDRKSVVSGKRGSGLVVLGGRRRNI